MSDFPRSHIGLHVEPVATWNPRASGVDEPLTYIDISSVDRDSKGIIGTEQIVPSLAPSRARQLVRAGDVLVSTVRPNLNAVACVPPQMDGATASTGFCVLRPRPSELDSQYLYYWVRTQHFIDQMLSRATGASYPAVSDSVVMSASLPLPSLPEQRRIAAILDRADAIRHKRQQALQLTDDLLRSAFLHMFGDPVTNPNGWRQARLDSVAEIRSGITKGRRLDPAQVVSVPYMRVANVQDGRIVLHDVKEIDVLHSEVDTFRLVAGDILLTEGGDPDKLGRGAVWLGQIDPCVHQNHIFRVRPDTSVVLSDFLATLIGSTRGKAYFLRAAKQTTGIATINRTQLGDFPVLLPPVGLQQRYAALVEQMGALQARAQARCREGDALFESLRQCAFRGELTSPASAQAAETNPRPDHA